MISKPWKTYLSKASALIALVLVLGLRVSAGIVEDAEEELKKIDSKKTAVTVQVPNLNESPSFPISDGGTPASGSSAASTANVDSSKSGGQSRGGGLGVVNIDDQSTEQVAKRPRNSKRSSKDKLYSLFGVLFLLALVAIGAALGKEGVREA